MVCQHKPRAAARERHPVWPATLAVGMVAAVGFAAPGGAQNVADVQRELTEMRRHYDAELKRLQRDYDSRIRRLETQLKAAQSKAPPPPQRGPVEAPVGPVAMVAPSPQPPGAPLTLPGS